MEIATNNPVTIVPTRTPPRTFGPRMKPIRIGDTTGIAPGTIIFWMAALVTISTQVPYWGLPVPSMIPLISRNCRRTSFTTSPAASPTAFIQSDAKRNGSIPPSKSPTMTSGSERSNPPLFSPPTARAYSANKTTAASPADPIA